MIDLFHPKPLRKTIRPTPFPFPSWASPCPFLPRSQNGGGDPKPSVVNFTSEADPSGDGPAPMLSSKLTQEGGGGPSGGRTVRGGGRRSPQRGRGVETILFGRRGFSAIRRRPTTDGKGSASLRPKAHCSESSAVKEAAELVAELGERWDET
eukprot:scaffold1052_cov339-Pavlova_lutheri.AAC.16